MVSVCTVFPETDKLFSRGAVSFYIPQQCMSDPVSPQPCQHLVLITVFHFSHFDKYVVISHCGLICIPLMTNVEYFFMYLFATNIFSLVNCLCMSCSFSNWIVGFFNAEF